MMDQKVGNLARDIMKTALHAAEQAKRANFIHVLWKHHICTVTTHVNGIDAAWINYNSKQLDELIRLLQLARSEMERPSAD